MEHKYLNKSFNDLWKIPKARNSNTKYTRTFISVLNSFLLLFSSFQFDYILTQIFYLVILLFCGL